MRVLLVDDHPVVRAGLRALISGFDQMTVAAEASHGVEALELLDAGLDVDVVVMDLQMPEMDGVRTTAEVRRRGGPPVLVLTTFDTQADVVVALRAGAVGYLLKDAPAPTLRQALIDTAQRRATLAPEVASAVVEQLHRPQPTLSAREIELLEALATGASNRELAATLFISQATVKTHLVHIYDKLGVTNRTAAIAAAREQRLI
ncbi:response regulator [Citricoccus muralis]|uniref:Response regulator transcription factor n=1 Tax=Citricoccus muralis TaxID=169134 RepID=A0ABY8H566_9MICC|nr:response regulator transcription factor [Citricoccus muralis]WFP16076.1 response regulator transcription factor [Citricoccus muralis]